MIFSCLCSVKTVWGGAGKTGMFFRPLDTHLSYIAVLGNALPRRCGLATYTSHSVQALRKTHPALAIDHYAMDDGHGISYDRDVAMAIPADDVSAYVRAARAIAQAGAQLLWIHHEFGIFGGAAGDHLLTLLRHLDMPVVVTLHTVLERPNHDQRRVMHALVGAADRLIVMAQEAARILVEAYHVDPARIEVIPHGAPDRPLSDTRPFKTRLGLGEGPIVLTFGLLSPGKGIEAAIRALPSVVARHPDLRYFIVGATHPALVREQGEAYRDSLVALAENLGVDRHVRFVDRFLDDEELLDYLQAADIYLTPYPGREQVTSGTLSYALAMGKAIISTPYIHAEEVLAEGVGTLVPPGEAEPIARALLDHLDDADRLATQSAKAWAAARSTIWQENARSVMDVFLDAKAGSPVALPGATAAPVSLVVQITGVAAMTDDLGIIQHSIHGIPDRCHGYCIDDNCRALKLVCETRAGDPVERQRLALIYAAFVEHAWNEDAGSFRNFMGYDRCWLETEGSADSNGRTLWTLGHVMREAPQDFLRRWANGLFNKALPLAEQLSSPRAIAFSMLGAAAVLQAEPGHEQCRAFLRKATAEFKNLLEAAQRPAWPWFEIVLAYDNARLPQAMIDAGRALNDPGAISTGLATLRWLLEQQTSPRGYFRPVGTESFGAPFAPPAAFDQQPLEATATIDACLSAYRADADPFWIEAAASAARWFEGENDLSMPLSSEDGTLCYDGLTRQGVNLNMGAESILALQMARHAMAALTGESEDKPQLSVVQ
jgi:glycosyltransferase involved in cell wall biosynthesis